VDVVNQTLRRHPVSQPYVFYQWFDELMKQMSCLSKPQARVQAMFSMGVARARACTLRKVSERLGMFGKPDTVERRLQRFLSNPGLDVAACSRQFASWVVSAMGPSKMVVLLVDETSLKDRLKLMAVSLAYHGRAIPLAWRSYPQTNWPMRQVALVKTLVANISVPEGTAVLVEADRGIGTSPELIRAVQRMGYYFLFRVQSQVRLVLEDGRRVKFGELIRERGGRFSGPVYAFKKAGWLRCWAVGQWAPEHDEPWLLLTNWPEAQGNDYGLRMWQELAFRDFKSFGWQWERSRVWQPRRADLMWLVMALAYVWVLSMGTLVATHPDLSRELSRGRQRRHSLFSLGLAYFDRWLDLGRHMLYHLCLSPTIPGSAKTVV
jgi:hypothetical protein